MRLQVYFLVGLFWYSLSYRYQAEEVRSSVVALGRADLCTRQHTRSGDAPESS
jgi:hypothetical protein